jgi:hypothetical protein
MAEIRETHVDRDEDGRVTERVIVERPKKKGGFGWGMLFGALLIAAAVIGFGYSQGSFQQAGVQADQVAAQVEQSSDSAVDATSDAVNDAAQTTDQAMNNETGETATN